MHNNFPNPAGVDSPAAGIQSITPSTSASASLHTRLGHVCELLPRAALHADDNLEHVHQLRIATRRAIAALDAYQELLPAKDEAWLRKRLKRIHSAAGDARDLDVMLSRLNRWTGRKSRTLIRYVQRKRAKAQKPLFRIHKRLESHGCFRNRVEQFLISIRQETKMPLANWATRRVQDAADSFFASVPDDNPSDESLHRFRLEAKHLRYFLELFDETDIQAIKSRLYPTVRRIQSTLGDLNDHVVAAKRLKRMSRDSKAKKFAPQLLKLSKQDEERAKKKRKQFAKKWRCKRLSKMKHSFDAIRQDVDVRGGLNP